MKKIFVLIAILAAAISCGKKDDGIIDPSNTQLVPLSFRAVGDVTKTSLDGQNIIWSTSDKINVFSGASFGTNEQFTVSTTESSGHIATFDGLGLVSPEYYALSPYQAGATITSAGVITAVLPEAQNAVAGSFGPKANLSVANVQGGVEELQFKNVGALLAVTVPADVTGLKVEALGGEMMTGTAQISYNGGEPSVNITTGYSYVETAISGAGTYYLVVFPNNFASGFRITLSRPGYTATLEKGSAINVERNDIVNLADITTVPSNAWKVVFTPGEKVYIKGISVANENGQEMSYISADYYNPRPGGVAPTNPTPGDIAALGGITYNYEVWAKIAHDDKVYFETENGSRFAISNEAGTGVAPIAPDGDGRAFAVSEDVYRIRLNLSATGEGDAQILRVTWINYSIFYGDVSQNLDSNNYDRNGTWKLDNFVFSYSTNQGWDPTNHRYRFAVWFTWKGGYGGEGINIWQSYGTCTQYTDVYGVTTGPDDDYYYLQPFTGDDWDMIFYLPKETVFPGMVNQCKKGTLNVCFNNTYGHFTHGFTNIVDNI